MGINTRGNYTPRSPFNRQLYIDTPWPNMPLKMFNIIIPLHHSSWLTFEVFLLFRSLCWAPMPVGLGVGGGYESLLKSTCFRPLLQSSYFSKWHLETKEAKLYCTLLPYPSEPLTQRMNAWSQEKMFILLLWFHDHEESSCQNQREGYSTSELPVYWELLLILLIYDS